MSNSRYQINASLALTSNTQGTFTFPTNMGEITYYEFRSRNGQAIRFSTKDGHVNGSSGTDYLTIGAGTDWSTRNEKLSLPPGTKLYFLNPSSSDTVEIYYNTK